MVFDGQSRPRRIAREVAASLPQPHQRTSLPEPENDSPLDGRDIHTGSDDVTALRFWPHRLLGVVFWVGWLAWGVYTWWFVDRTITDFVIGVVVWTGAFVFTIIGVPLVSRAARNRNPL